jgi:hypothetical protein
MAKDVSLFMSINDVNERNIYVVDDFYFGIVGQADVTNQHGRSFDIYHVPNLSANMLFVS